MSKQTKERGIAWAQGADGSPGETWNPVRGCSRVSAGCQHCYAETMAARFSGPGQPYHGLAMATPSGPRWTGEVRLVAEHLADPLRWKRPRTIFVNSMSDLFHERLTNEQIAAVFGVMAAAPRHTFQCLTTRPKRMREWFAVRGIAEQVDGFKHIALSGRIAEYFTPERLAPAIDKEKQWAPEYTPEWPLRSVHLGVSVENQPSADARLDDLLACPAAVRWCSYEPALAGVDFGRWLRPCPQCNGTGEFAEEHDYCAEMLGCPCMGYRPLDWIVIGGESGHNARPFDLAWARSTIAVCKAAGVACFVKQMGAHPIIADPPRVGLPRAKWPEMEWPEGTRFGNPTGDKALNGRIVFLHDPAGGDPAEWPEDLRVRQWPNQSGRATT